MKNLSILIIVFLMSNSVFGHTCSPEKVKCPIDKTTVEFCVTMSMTTFGSYNDFQKKGAIGSHYQELINSCSKCHYSGYLDDFKKTFDDEKKDSIKQFLSQYDGIEINDGIESKIAGDLNEYLNSKNDDISYYYLIGTYVTRLDTTKNGLRKELQSLTKQFLQNAINNNEYKDSTAIATISYLVAEMCRRTGEFKTAIEYYDKAINDANKKDWVENVAIRQKELAIKEDDNNLI